MLDLFKHTASDRGILYFHGLVHPADTESLEVCDLTLGLSILGADLGNLKLCHSLSGLTVKNFAHGNAAKTGHGVSVPHLRKSSDSGFHQVVRVG